MRELRFYEKEPTVRRAVEALFLFPPDIQRVLAGGFTLIAERDFRMQEVANRGKNLGVDKVISLHKSKQKKRPYDHCPITHKAMNYLMMMNVESQVFLANKILELMGFMQEYLKLCKDYGTLPDEHVVQEISDTYMHKGAASARVFITVLSREFKARLLAKPENAPTGSTEQGGKSGAVQKPANNASEAIQSQQSGMKIKGEL